MPQADVQESRYQMRLRIVPLPNAGIVRGTRALKYRSAIQRSRVPFS